MTTYLLDVNLLLALTDPMHIHHQSAHGWFVEKGRQAWASCPLTENGFIRIASHPNYPNRPGDVDVIVTHAQITDVYLLGLAVHKRGKLATLDQRIPVDAVRGRRKALELLIP
jgi:predicted nucleic acid-binding protein